MMTRNLNTSYTVYKPCRVFEFPEIQQATENFNESLVIGHGGFGKVYKGTILNGSSFMVSAIKRLDSLSSQGPAEFWAEVKILSKLRHCNLVSLIGYCNYGREMILVYEYMSNGTLEDHLHKLGTCLSWIQRLKICIGAGRGLHYLHTGTGIDVGIIHRDVKTSNILLDETWAAKISNFGLSRIGPTNQPLTYVNTLVKGTFGYLDPEYYTTGKLTRKSDVYAFGVVLLELLCRRRALDTSLDEEQCNLARWAQESIKQGNLKLIIDSDIRDQIYPKCLKEFVRIAKRCLLSNPKQRSTMTDVVGRLESLLNVQEHFNSSSQVPGRTLFGRMADMFPFPSNEEISDTIRKLVSLRYQTNANRLIPEVTGSFNVPFYSYKEIERASNNFSEKQILGIGAYGTVYAGKLNKDEWVAIKRIRDTKTYGIDRVMNEIKIISGVSHLNLLHLLGCCIEKGEQILVYEFMPNGTLSQHLNRQRGSGLRWSLRLSIAAETEQAIAYLHSDMNPPIYHRDIESSNILLDYNYRVKVADFGHSRLGMPDGSHILTAPQWTPGYIDPQYHQHFHLSNKNDVYSFGVVLAEIITALKAVDLHSEVSLAALFVDKTGKGCVDEIIDPFLDPNKDAWTLWSIHKVADLALQCLNFQGDMRPTMEEVANELEHIVLIGIQLYNNITETSFSFASTSL